MQSPIVGVPTFQRPHGVAGRQDEGLLPFGRVIGVARERSDFERRVGRLGKKQGGERCQLAAATAILVASVSSVATPATVIAKSLASVSAVAPANAYRRKTEYAKTLSLLRGQNRKIHRSLAGFLRVA